MSWLKKLTDIGVREGCAVQIVYVPVFLGGGPETSPVLPEVGDVGLVQSIRHVYDDDNPYGSSVSHKEYEVLWLRIGKPVRVYRRQIRRV